MRFGIKKTPGSTTTVIDQADGRAVVEPLSKDQFSKIEASLGYTFNDYARLERALTHRSATTAGTKQDYERLEYLGDAVLDLIIAVLLLDAHPTAREGDLSKMRAALVNTKSLAEVALSIDLDKFIRLSRGELANGGATRPSILADVFEAVIGAVYREAGHDRVLEVIKQLFGDRIHTVTPRDPKTELQEVLHAIGDAVPNYILEGVEGPEHQPTFISAVTVQDKVLGRGSGPTKKASQQAAAQQALTFLKEHSLASAPETISEATEETENQP